MWLPLLICLGAIALLVGPIMLMQPTRSQRRLAQLREAAMAAGLRVHLQAPPAGAKIASGAALVAAYCLPWKESVMAKSVWQLVKKGFAHELHAAAEWDWSEAPGQFDWSAFRPCLEQVPAKVFAIASGPQGLCCYWTEQGDSEDVQLIAAWLEASAKVLRNAGKRRPEVSQS